MVVGTSPPENKKRKKNQTKKKNKKKRKKNDVHPDKEASPPVADVTTLDADVDVEAVADATVHSPTKKFKTGLEGCKIVPMDQIELKFDYSHCKDVDKTLKKRIATMEAKNLQVKKGWEGKGMPPHKPPTQ